MIPLVILIVLYSMNFGYSISKHGEMYKINAWTTVASTIILFILIAAIVKTI